MYPLDHFRLFPAYPMTKRVFVVMDFSHEFDARWLSVIQPGVKRVHVNGEPLSAHRVDTSRISASLLSEILEGIGRELLLFADITTIHRLENGRALRNANVMYELGIAHAIRLPEENLVFRSDGDALPFDVANIRVNSYSPDTDVAGSIKVVSEAILDALQTRNERRRVSVQKAAESLDGRAATQLMNAVAKKKTIQVSKPNSMGSILGMRSIERLLELGAIRATWPAVNDSTLPAILKDPAALPAAVRYEVTPFGVAVARAIIDILFAQVTPRMREVVKSEAEAQGLNVTPESAEVSTIEGKHG